MLNSAGIKTELSGNDLYIYGGEPHGFNIEGNNDHRTVMSGAILASYSKGGSTVTDSEAVAKSYQDFFEDLKRLGGVVDVDI